MATERGCYVVLNDEQKRILCKYFEKGMTTTAPSVHPFIEQAADEANLSNDKVKKWIGNERRKQKASTAFPNNMEEKQTNKLPSKRAVTGYNLFCSKIMNSDDCQMLSSKSEKMKFAVEKWKSLSLEDCEKWKENAREIANNCSTELTPKQKKAQVLKAKKQLVSQLSYLESLGCDASVMIFEHESKEISHYGTGQGLKYLTENNDTVIKFMEFFECSDQKYSASDVAAMFNRKYREASGKPCARVPYHRGGFQVTGLPDGVEFKKPTGYGNKTIQTIMINSENIKFSIVENQIGDGDEQATGTAAKYYQVLEKVVDSDKIIKYLSGEITIKEEDLEVANLDLSPNDFQVLVTDLHSHFEKDAMSSLIANYQSSLNHNGYILPVYTEAEDPYWLFYYAGRAVEFETLLPQDNISGYWLDKASSKLEFKLLHKKTSIKALNVICIDGNLGSLRLRKNLVLCNDTTVVLPIDFDTSILKCLERQGLL